MPFSVREGINIFLSGFVPTENLRFREEELSFKLSTQQGKISLYLFLVRSLKYFSVYLPLDILEGPQRSSTSRYPVMTKTMRGGGEINDSNEFKLHVEAGAFTDSEIIVMLGENGTGIFFSKTIE